MNNTQPDKQKQQKLWAAGLSSEKKNYSIFNIERKRILRERQAFFEYQFLPTKEYTRINRRRFETRRRYLREKIKDTSLFCCKSCGVSGEASFLELDHILPLKNGGNNELENIQLLCNVCHKEKTKNDR